MAYSTGDEYFLERQVYVNDIATGAQVVYDFSSAGYAANALLDDETKGKYTFSMVDPSGTVPLVMVDGLMVLATDIPLRLVPNPPATPTLAYLRLNLPSIPGTYTAKTFFRKTSGLNAVTLSFQIIVN